MSVRRRTFLLGAGAATALAVSGCDGRKADPVRAAAPADSVDLRTIALAAELEDRAISFYRTLLAVPRTGNAPALDRLAATCLRHHEEHAATWNAILRSARRPAVTSAARTGELRSARTVSRVITLAAELEDEAARTYATAVGHVASPVLVAAAAGIAPVEAMHAATLRFLLGEYPSLGVLG
jgi:rubrerythrin